MSSNSPTTNNSHQQQPQFTSSSQLPSRSSANQQRRRSRSRPRRTSSSRTPLPSRNAASASASHRRNRSRDRRTSTSPPQGGYSSNYRSSSAYPRQPPPPRLTEEEARLRDARCVFVTQLQVKATEDDVRFFFEAMCKVDEVALIKEKSTGRSKGFGYVELATFEDVQSALLLSGLPFFWRDGTKGFPITVRPSEAYKQYMEHGAVVVTSNKQHQQMLKSSYQNTNSSSIAAGGGEQRIELIEMAGPGSALASIDGGPPVILPTHRGKPMNTKILFVGNIDKSLGEKELKEVFQSFGAVENVQVKTDVETGESKGFAFCRFEQVASAANANDKLNGFELMGLRLSCNPVNDKMLMSSSSSSRGGGRRDDAFTSLDDEDASSAAAGGKGVNLHANRRMELMSKLGGGAAQEWVQNTTAAAANAANQAMYYEATPQASGATPRIALSNMFNAATETQPQWEVEIERDTKEECEKFGRVISCVVDKRTNLVYVTFTSAADATKCANTLEGRWFDRNQIHVTFLPMT